MKYQPVWHSLLLLFAIFLTFLWVNDEILANYSLQLTAFLLLAVLLIRHLHRSSAYKLAESTVSTISVLLITSATGGLSSPLFFLNHLLLFELSFLLEPSIPITLSIGLMVFYLYSHQVGGSPTQLLILFSFPVMTPLAYFFGKLYLKEENQKKEIRNLSQKLIY